MSAKSWEDDEKGRDRDSSTAVAPTHGRGGRHDSSSMALVLPICQHSFSGGSSGSSASARTIVDLTAACARKLDLSMSTLMRFKLMSMFGEHGLYRSSLLGLRSIGSRGRVPIDGIPGSMKQLKLLPGKRELEDVRSPEIQQSRLDSLRIQLEASDSTTLARRSRKSSNTRMDFEATFSLMEGLLKQSLPSQMPSLSQLFRSSLHDYTRGLSMAEQFDAMFAFGNNGNATSSCTECLPQGSFVLALPPPSIARSESPKTKFNYAIAAAIAEATAPIKHRMLAQLATESNLQVGRYRRSAKYPAQLSSCLVDQLLNTNAEACKCALYYHAAPFTPGLVAQLPKSHSMIEHAGGSSRSSDSEHSMEAEENLMDLEDQKLLTQLACPSIAPTCPSTAPSSDAPPLSVELPEDGAPDARAS